MTNTNLYSTTTISALKLYEMKSLNSSSDPTYTSVNLSIFAIAEVFVGAFTASLPPLRKTFENQLHKVLPQSLIGSSRGTRNSYMVRAAETERSVKSVLPRSADDDSQRGMFSSDQSSVGKEGELAITRTTVVTIAADGEMVLSRHRQDDWA